MSDTTEHDDELPPPKVTDSPERIWLNYGDIEFDATHQECCRSGEVTWCEDSVFVSDVKYVRADVLEQQAAQIAAKDAEIAALRADAERYRWWREYGLTTESEHRSIENELLPAGEIFRTLNDAIDAALRQEQPHG